MACVRRLRLHIMPNGQLTQLAIPKYRDASKGEVDFTATESTTGTAQLRLRALILTDLSCEIYGGQTFHHDNGIVANISNSTVSLHDGVFIIQLPHHNRDRHPPASIFKPVACSSSVLPPLPRNTHTHHKYQTSLQHQIYKQQNQLTDIRRFTNS